MKIVMRVDIPTYTILNTLTIHVDIFKEGLSLVIKNFRKKKQFLGETLTSQYLNHCAHFKSDFFPPLVIRHLFLMEK